MHVQTIKIAIAYSEDLRIPDASAFLRALCDNFQPHGPENGLFVRNIIGSHCFSINALGMSGGGALESLRAIERPYSWTRRYLNIPVGSPDHGRRHIDCPNRDPVRGQGWPGEIRNLLSPYLRVTTLGRGSKRRGGKESIEASGVACTNCSNQQHKSWQKYIVHCLSRLKMHFKTFGQRQKKLLRI